jgi:hypothetical protein
MSHHSTNFLAREPSSRQQPKRRVFEVIRANTGGTKLNVSIVDFTTV